MLRIDNGQLIIQLNAPSTPRPIWAGVLLVLALVVAVIMMTMPSAYALMALFVLAVVCFVFNLFRLRAKKHVIGQGVIKAVPFLLTLDDTSLPIGADTTIAINDDKMIIQNQHHKWILLGFEHPKEMQVLKAVLLGQKPITRQVAIKLQDS